MFKPSLASLVSAFALVALPSVAAAAPAGAEIVDQTLQVTTNGVTNSVHFAPGGVAHITSPAGKTVTASWTANNGQLCLLTGAAQECWPYQEAFQAGQAKTLVSNCNASSTWLANSVNQPPVEQKPLGERG